MRVPDLESFVGKTIADCCANGFAGADINHCAHFVSHVVASDFGYTCKKHTGGRKAGANIRVHEVFAECPRVGEWPWAGEGDCLIFVTRKENVDLARKVMVNHPKKHIGIWQDGHVYHYSNGRDRVVRQAFDEFKRDFDRAYGGTQGYFFGSVPGDGLTLRVDLTAASVDAARKFTIEERASHYFARCAGEPEFLLGKKTRYGSRFGVFLPANEYYGPRFAARDYEPVYDHWATILEVIGSNESKNYFNVINTYDGAAFTFGFFQLAAHTANDNLVLYLRAMLDTEEGRAYFPELRMIGGRIHRVHDDGAELNIESPPSRLMAYLNPDSTKVDDQELLHIARFIHGSNSSQRLRDIQVEVSTTITMGKVSQRYHPWYGLDGLSDTIVATIADIHHQGRATKPAVKAALQSSAPEDALIALGQAKYPERVANLRETIRSLKAEGRLGRKRYRAASNTFE